MGIATSYFIKIERESKSDPLGVRNTLFQIPAQCVTPCWVSLHESLIDFYLNFCTLKNKIKIPLQSFVCLFGGWVECGSIKYFHCIEQWRIQNRYSVNVGSLLPLFWNLRCFPLDFGCFLHSPANPLYPIRTVLFYWGFNHSQISFWCESQSSLYSDFPFLTYFWRIKHQVFRKILKWNKTHKQSIRDNCGKGSFCYEVISLAEMLQVKQCKNTQKGLFWAAERKVGKSPNLMDVYLNSRSDLTTAECLK